MKPADAPRNIAYNIRRLRRARGWTQVQAAEAMRSLGGPDWNKQAWSWAERSAEIDRVRQFTAEEIAYLAETFEVSIAELFAQPPVPCPHCDGTGWIEADRIREEGTTIDG
jgi:transcriptional regulator with XRE-family HTH domain